MCFARLMFANVYRERKRASRDSVSKQRRQHSFLGAHLTRTAGFLFLLHFRGEYSQALYSYIYKHRRTVHAHYDLCVEEKSGWLTSRESGIFTTATASVAALLFRAPHKIVVCQDLSRNLGL